MSDPAYSFRGTIEEALSEKQKIGLLSLAKRGTEVVGTRRLPVKTLAVLRRLGLVEPAGENDNPYTGVWQLTATGHRAVGELITV